MTTLQVLDACEVFGVERPDKIQAAIGHLDKGDVATYLDAVKTRLSKLPPPTQASIGNATDAMGVCTRQ